MSTPPTSELPQSLQDLGPVEVPSAAEAVADRLKRAIHLGMFREGERLPAERKLAARLGVSRVTLRAALHVLQGAGYVTTSRGARGGSEVIAAAGTTPALRRAGLLERIDEVARVIEFRAVIETGAAELAAGRRDEADLRRLELAVDELEAVNDVSGLRRADARFHLAVAQAAGNPMLEQAVVGAREAMFVPIDVLPYRPAVRRTRLEHTAIAAAIAEGDAPAAGARMTAHVHRSLAELRQVLGLDAL